MRDGPQAPGEAQEGGARVTGARREEECPHSRVQVLPAEAGQAERQVPQVTRKEAEVETLRCLSWAVHGHRALAVSMDGARACPGHMAGHLWLHRPPDRCICGGTLDCEAGTLPFLRQAGQSQT